MFKLFRETEKAELGHGSRTLEAERDHLLQQIKGELASMHYDTPQELVRQIQLMAGTLARLMHVAKQMCENEYLMRETP